MSLKSLRILVVDDDPDVLTAVRLLLKNKVQEVVTAPNPEHIPRLLEATPFDLLLLDMNFKSSLHTGNEGLYWIRRVREMAPKIQLVMITAYGDVDLAVRSLKDGADDFILKPWQNDKLIETLHECLRRRERPQKNPEETPSAAPSMVGQSPCMQQIYRIIEKVAPTEANVLILGENGTGKELLAEAIHRQSQRANKVFVKVDAGSLSETLFESELFGHKKGSFTDAREDRMGRFEAANGGTLFLDEIGNLSLPQQAKLLSVLQNRSLTRIGENRPIPIDIRLVCATNLSLSELSNEARFRKDLMYRINTVELTLPPLRERDEDLILLAQHFLKLYGKKYLKAEMQISEQALQKLRRYPFPGNIRELQYAIERAVIMCESETLGPQDLLFSALEHSSPAPPPDNLRLSEVEKDTILKVLDKHQGNISRAAKELGITRTALYRRLEKFNLARDF